MFSALLALLALITSAVLTVIFCNYANKNCLLDIPNQRSSHTIPTPRGGGLAIVISFLLFVTILYLRNAILQQVFLAFTGGGLLVALIGFADDHKHVKVKLRLTIHFIAAGIGLYYLGGFSLGFTEPTSVFSGILGNLFGVVFLVWLLNLFNFMDGIDGIAASETIFIAGGAASIIIITGGWSTGTLILLLLLIAACSGFLIWNWPPAKIFMGDVGSGFLGIILGFFAIMTMNNGEMSFFTWLILFGAFFVDATVTLIRRIFTGQRWYSAHRSHAYQILARRLGSHKRVTAIVILLNIFWLYPLACFSTLYPTYNLLLTCVALIPLGWGVYRLGAGNEES
ncbi:MAG: hypothetical protein VR65_07905 [Desulfobulbaceae bacterium BRH_c16a]|nr:MAG: hypothetical protein VR65_07905 [Desulfobulbaceae bacterium BRH_c16a]